MMCRMEDCKEPENISPMLKSLESCQRAVKPLDIKVSDAVHYFSCCLE